MLLKVGNLKARPPQAIDARPAQINPIGVNKNENATIALITPTGIVYHQRLPK